MGGGWVVWLAREWCGESYGIADHDCQGYGHRWLFPLAAPGAPRRLFSATGGHDGSAAC
jgi:hypothetical protein